MIGADRIRRARAPQRAGPAVAPPDRVTVERLIALKGSGESLKLAAPRVRALASGGHLSPFRGRGVEFDESRPYEAGDDLRTMDWKVTARTGKPHTKIFREERNRPVIVWLDLRGSMLFGTQGAYKGVRAAEAAALIAWSAVGNGDRLGGLVFSQARHHEQRPRLGRRAALELLERIADERFWSPARSGGAGGVDGGAEHALARLTRVARPGSMIFLLSDFLDFGDEAERHVRQLSSRGDVYLMHFYDPIEAELPPPGRYRIIVDSRSVAIDTSDEAVRLRYRARFEARRARLQSLARAPGVYAVDCPTTEEPRAVLAQRFRQRGT